ncbi:hypothetical protein [Nocardiopsis alborubida]|nr:hypothetical protein [Nocardiopsis alborubida]
MHTPTPDPSVRGASRHRTDRGPATASTALPTCAHDRRHGG